jgi:hypothetical protein
MHVDAKTELYCDLELWRETALQWQLVQAHDKN